jgi:hypothetical protein
MTPPAPQHVDKLTLDTNVLRDYWDDRAARELVEQILELAARGELDLAVAAYIDRDITHGRLADRVAELPALGVRKTIGVWELGVSRLGIDTRLGDQRVVDLEVAFNARRAATGGAKPPEHEDWLHLHTHLLERRDYFLTLDKAILRIADELGALGIVVCTPADYLARRSASPA